MLIKKHQQEPLKKDMRLGFFFFAALLLVFATHLVSEPISIGLTLLSFIAFTLFAGFYVLLANPTLIKMLHADFETKPAHRWLVPCGLWGVALIYALLSDQFTLPLVSLGLLYCLLPFVLYIYLQNAQPILHWFDVIVILLLWFPIEFGWIPDLNIPPTSGTVKVYNIIGLILIIFLYFILRALPDTGFTYRLKGKDWRSIIQNFIFFMPFALIIGLATGFIEFAKRLPPTGEMIASFIAILFFIALPEEILFRGVIHNLLEKRLAPKKNGTVIALVISSVIFGLAHGNNSNPPFLDIDLGPLGIWHAPWVYILLATIAGVFYGLTYVKTRKVTAAALVHLLVDWVWGVFFK